MLRSFFALFGLLLLGLIVLASAQSMTGTADANALALLETPNEQITQGAELYDWHCAVCHGDSALGFAEAKSAFPEDHQHCTRCHRSNNPKIMAKMSITPKNSFALGDPPALQGEGTLQAFPNAAALHTYIRATMPRYEPGRLSDEEYWAITAFLLALHGPSPDDTLDANSAQSYELAH